MGDAVLPGQIVGGDQAVPAAAHDDGIVERLGVGTAPRLGSVFVVADGVAQQAE